MRYLGLEHSGDALYFRGRLLTHFAFTELNEVEKDDLRALVDSISGMEDPREDIEEHVRWKIEREEAEAEKVAKEAKKSEKAKAKAAKAAKAAEASGDG